MPEADLTEQLVGPRLGVGRATRGSHRPGGRCPGADRVGKRLNLWKMNPRYSRRNAVSSSGRSPRDLLAEDHDAAVIGSQDASQEREQRRLAAAGRADQEDRLAAIHLQADAVEDRRPPLTRSEPFVDVAHHDGRFHEIPVLSFPRTVFAFQGRGLRAITIERMRTVDGRSGHDPGSYAQDTDSILSKCYHSRPPRG